MGSYWFLLGSYRVCLGFLWVPMGSYEFLWGPMGSYGFLLGSYWVPLGSVWFPCVPLWAIFLVILFISGPSWSLWVPMRRFSCRFCFDSLLFVTVRLLTLPTRSLL